MEVENFKEQQQDRIEEGKDLKREDELTDLSQIPSKQLPGAENKSLLTKISEGISNVASVICKNFTMNYYLFQSFQLIKLDIIQSSKDMKTLTEMLRNKSRK